MRKIIIILLLFTSLRTMISCCKQVGFNFRWSKAIVTNLNVSTNTPSPLISDSSKIDNYGFRLSFEYEEVAYNFINEFSFNKTYALKCIANYQNKDSATSIDVITLNNFDNTHPAGSSVANYLLARPGNRHFYGVPNPFTLINDNINYLNEAFTIGNNILDFKFKNITPFPGQHTFTVIVSFKSGRTLSGNTSIILY